MARCYVHSTKKKHRNGIRRARRMALRMGNCQGACGTVPSQGRYLPQAAGMVQGWRQQWSHGKGAITPSGPCGCQTQHKWTVAALILYFAELCDHAGSHGVAGIAQRKSSKPLVFGIGCERNGLAQFNGHNGIDIGTNASEERMTEKNTVKVQ